MKDLALHQSKAQTGDRFKVPKSILQNKPLAISTMLLFALMLGLLAGINGLFAIIFLAIPFVVLMFYNPTYAFYLLVLTLPLYVVQVQFIAASVPRVAGIIMVIAWIPYVFFTHKFKLIKWNKFLVLTVVFFGWLMLSILWSHHPVQGIVRMRTLSQLIFAMFIGITLIDKKDKFHHIIIIVLVTCAIAGFRSFFLSLYSPDRAVGIEGFDQNEFASMLIMPLIVALSLFNFHRSKLIMSALLIIMICCFFGALSTVSRGFVVSVASAFIALFIMEPNKKKMLALVIILSLIAAPYYLKRYGDRLGEEDFEIGQTAKAPIGRMGIWHIGLEIFKNYPIHGVGIGGFSEAFNVELEKEPTRITFWKYGRVAHNDYLQIATELGIIGLILWIMFIVEVFKKSFRTRVILERLEEKYLSAVIRGMVASMFGLMVASMFLGLYYSKYMWLLLMMFLFLGYITRDLKKQSQNPEVLKLPDP